MFGYQKRLIPFLVYESQVRQSKSAPPAENRLQAAATLLCGDSLAGVRDDFASVSAYAVAVYFELIVKTFTGSGTATFPLPVLLNQRASRPLPVVISRGASD